MLILDLWGISFHAMVVFDLGKNLLFESVLGQDIVYTLRINFLTFSYMRVSSFGHANGIVCIVAYSCNKTDEGELLRKK